MSANKPRPGRLLVVTILGVLLCWPAVAVGAPPAHDQFDDATVVSSFPFSQQVSSLGEATVDPDDPPGCFDTGGNVWYRLEPTETEALRLTLFGSIFAQWLVVFRDTGSGIGGLERTTCVHVIDPYELTVTGGDVYYVMVGRTLNSVAAPPILDITVVPPPTNDHFANAVPITAVPSSHSVDTSGATFEPGEPATCSDPSSQKTVWYSYTPTSSGVVIARALSADSAALSAYVGSALPELSALGCVVAGSPLTIVVEAGLTYYLQAGLFGTRHGAIDLTLEPAPPPLAEVTFFPPDPTSLETVHLDAHVVDPAQQPFTVTWDFGDGATATDQFTAHRFTVDGDYTVTMTATTQDGRSTTVVRALSVRTHDVDIARFDTPATARAGQSRPIRIDVSNSRYSEAVEVSLFKSIPNGDFVHIGSVTQFVPAEEFPHTTTFRFTYTFSADDADATKVTFRAAATIAQRDALPADNAITATPTRINR